PVGVSISRNAHDETRQLQQASRTFVVSLKTLFKLLNMIADAIMWQNLCCKNQGQLMKITQLITPWPVLTTSSGHLKGKLKHKQKEVEHMLSALKSAMESGETHDELVHEYQLLPFREHYRKIRKERMTRKHYIELKNGMTNKTTIPGVMATNRTCMSLHKQDRTE
ncbi:hypothetical protein J0S82_015219, partial [Galemys pyrenaicus]